jgi:hypothetical protein
MRVILASLLLLSAPALAQQNPADAPLKTLSPTLMQGWEAEPPSLTREEQIQLALRWAEMPIAQTAQNSRAAGRRSTGSRRSTVGQSSR